MAFLAASSADPLLVVEVDRLLNAFKESERFMETDALNAAAKQAAASHAAEGIRRSCTTMEKGQTRLTNKVVSHLRTIEDKFWIVNTRGISKHPHLLSVFECGALKHGRGRTSRRGQEKSRNGRDLTTNDRSS